MVMIRPNGPVLVATSTNGTLCRDEALPERLSAEDVLNLLWDCQGRITHLELFNLKDWQNGDMEHLQKINELQRAINAGSVPLLKQLIIAMLKEAAPGSLPGLADEASVSTLRVSEFIRYAAEENSRFISFFTSAPNADATRICFSLYAAPALFAASSAFIFV